MFICLFPGSRVTTDQTPVGHERFQQVSNGIKAGDQNVTGKQIREASSFLANVEYDLGRKMETFEEGNVKDAHVKHALTHHTLASQGHLARHANWDSMTRTAKKHWKIKQAKHKCTCTSETRDPRPYGQGLRFLFDKK
jgi:hypothetical protein